MTFGGWAFMIISLTFVVCLVCWSYYKVLTVPGEIEKPPDALGG